MAGTGTDRGPSRSNALAPGSVTAGQVGGGQNIWKVPLGDNSFNNGGPSTTVLDDVGGFNNQFLSNPVRTTNKFFEPEALPDEDAVDPNDWALKMKDPEPEESTPLTVPDWILADPKTPEP